jgi:hypothetical protein
MKQILTLALTLTLFSCGFKPMHVTKELQQTRSIQIETIAGTNGVDLRNNLRSIWGITGDSGGEYILQVKLQGPSRRFKGIQMTGDATWQTVRIEAEYKLSDAEGNILLSAVDFAEDSYTFVQDLVAAQASYNNSVQSTIRLLAEKIALRVNVALSK